MYRKYLILLAVALVTAWTGAFAAPVVLSNPYDVNSPDAINSTSHNGAPGYLCWSDFYYDGSYEITDFHWSGILQSNNFAQLAGFGFSIYAPDINNPGFPGTSIYSQFVAGNANATANGDLLSGSYDVYDFSLDLTSPWTASAGDYYFSVYGEFTGVSNAFYWGVSQNQYGADDLQFITGFGWQTVSTEGDLAWEVTGNRLNVVPEPATMTLLGLGLLGSALASRRAKNKNRKDM